MSVGSVGILALAVASTLSGSTIVSMQLLSSPGQPSIYNFLVDGSVMQLFCDDPSHPVNAIPYLATETNLSDLTGTLLDRAGDPQALLKYQEIAILDQQALSDPTMIRSVIIAGWSLTEGREARDPGAAALLNWVATQNPANYDLSHFVIFATPNQQEQTGFTGGGDVPEPGSAALGGIGILSLLLVGWRRSKSKTAHSPAGPATVA